MNQQHLKETADKERTSVFAFFVRNGHMAILLLIAAILGGLFSISSMPQESEPEVKIPIGVVTTIYPGASPADVEELITDEIENEIANLDSVKEITSNSMEGVSSIVVEFEADADLDESIRSLRDEVDQARAALPPEAEDPNVKQIRAGDEPIVTFALIGDVPLIEMKEYADALEDIYEDISGVNEVDVHGLPEREMQVHVNLQALESLELSVTDVANAIRSNHINIPLGSIRTDELIYQGSLKGEFETPEMLKGLVVTTRNGKNIFLRDIAEVREVFEQTSSETRIYRTEKKQFEQSITIDIRKIVGADLVAIVDEAKELTNQFSDEVLPPSVEVLVVDDTSKRIREDIRRLLSSALQTILVIALTLYLVLGTRESLMAAFSVPTLYLISLMGLAYIGETFNFLTFFSLILSLGIVVDTSIVIIEGMHENIQDHDLQPEDAALASLNAFKAPLISGSLTTISAFVPLALMTGIMGEYVKHIPITVNITLLSSLFVALLVLPATAKVFLRNHNGKKGKPPILDRWFIPLQVWYGTFIEKTLSSRKRRHIWMASMLAAFILSFGLLASGVVKFQLFGTPDVDFFFVSIDAPEGSSFEATRAIAQDAEEIVKETPELKYLVSTYGNGSSNTARILVTLTETNKRWAKSKDIADDLRSKLTAITAADITIEEASSGPPSGSDIEVRIFGKETKNIEKATEQLKVLLAKTPGTRDVDDDNTLAPGEYHFRLKRDQMAYFGMNAQQIGSILRTTIFGDSSVEITKAGEEIDILVQVDYRDERCLNDNLTQFIEAKQEVTICRNDPQTSDEIMSLLIPTPKGTVPLSELLTVELVPAVTTIRHFNTEQVVRVKASLEKDAILADVLSAFQEKLDGTTLPDGIAVQIGGENEDTAESMASLARASLVAILLIFGILVYQFGRFRQVFIIMMTLPLAVMGVLYGLALIRIPLSFPGMIGMVALLGIVVNDAIVLIDKINRNREFDMPVLDAVILGCKQRMQPVIITTLTTALGVIPLIWSSDVFRDLAIVVAIGITIATIFTLVMVPVLYVGLEKEKK